MKSFYQLVRHEGNHDLFRAVEMSIAALASGHPFHIHTEGLRGTGKTTILRSAASILPPITRIKGCLYNCDPDQPHCPDHRGLTQAEIVAIGKEEVPCPFLEISHGAKISTIIGSIDLAKLTDSLQPMAALLPGTIPQANRGIIFVDEINRLADASPEVADVLLDVMGTKPGRIQIEEAGLPTVEMPVQVTIWAASNPDEEPGALAQIRKQLSDRFDMAVGMGRPSEIQSVLDILMSRTTPQTVTVADCMPAVSMNAITIDDMTRKTLATIYVDYGLESLRTVEAMETAAKLNALLTRQNRVVVSDIAKVVPLVLAHRSDPATIANILKYLKNLGDEMGETQERVVAGEISTAAAQPNRRQQTSPNAKSRLADWWDALREKLSRKEEKKQLDTAKERHGKSPGGRGGSSGKSQQIADPTHLTMVAPPNPATPLNRLSLEEFVNTDEKVRHRGDHRV